jgi:hypothetical protein
MAVERLTLRAEIAEILREAGNVWMAPEEIVASIKDRGLFVYRNGQQITTKLICRQTRNYPNLFEREGTHARLRLTRESEG